MNKQNNGNSQLNSIRNEFNNRVSSTKFMGNSKRMKLINIEDLEQYKIL